MLKQYNSEKSQILKKLFNKPMRLFAILTITIAQTIQYLFNPKGSYVGDSFAYGYGPVRDWDSFSFFGNSLRNWPIVGMNLILNNPEFQVLFQSVLSVFAWSFLVIVLSAAIKAKYSSIVTILISCLAISPKILSWNSVILAESYSISLIVILFSIQLKLMKNATRSGKIYFVLIFYLWISLHPRNFYFAILLIVLFIALMFKNFLNLLMSNKITTIIICFLMIHVFIVSQNQGNQPFGENITYNQVAAFYAFSNHPSSSQVKDALLEVPEMKCITASTIDDIFELVKFASKNCQSSLSWIDSNFKLWYVNFLAKNPNFALTLVNYGLVAGNSPATLYAPHITILPMPIDMLFFGERNFFLGSMDSRSAEIDLQSLKVFAPVYLWVAIFLFILLLYFSRKNHSIIFCKNPLITHLLILTTWAFVSMISVFIIMPSEHFRLGIQFYCIFLVSLVCSVSIESTNDGSRPIISKLVL